MRTRCLLLLTFAAAAVFGQTAGKPSDNTKIFGPPSPERTDKQLLRTVTGMVKDADGNPVAGALVYLKEPRSGKERSVVAGPNGAYQFEELHKKWDYELRATKGKLASSTKTLSVFDTRSKPVMNLTIEAQPEKTEAK